MSALLDFRLSFEKRQSLTVRGENFMASCLKRPGRLRYQIRININRIVMRQTKWQQVDPHPYFVRGAWDPEAAQFHVQCSDLFSLWQSLSSAPDLLIQKQKFNQTFEVASVTDLAKTLLKVLSSESTAVRLKATEDWVQINATLHLQVFPFTWKFFLFRVAVSSKEVVSEYFLKPALSALSALSARHTQLQHSHDQVEKQLLGKLSQPQRKKYVPKKIPEVEQQTWLKTISQLDVPFRPGPAAELKEESKPLPDPSPLKQAQPKEEEPVAEQPSKKPSKQKKKKLDFI